MDEMYRKLALGAMLHDIGKLVQRASPGEGSHSRRGAEFIEEAFNTDEMKEVIECIKYHHTEELKDAGIPDQSPAYIVWEADNIAAGIDRRKKSFDDEHHYFKKELPLYSIFNTFKFDKNAPQTAFQLKMLRESETINFPEKVEAERLKLSPDKYTPILNSFSRGIREINLKTDTLESILKLLETHLVYVPSSTYTGEVPDISLYNHLKTTCAVAGCIYRYFEEQGVTDYKKVCFEGVAELRDKYIFLLVSGDFSGIQNFIYTISSQGALKSLRGRSFYLEIAAEHIIDEILCRCGLCRANLIYSGGGHFYILLPNTSAVRGILEQAKSEINRWFLKHYGLNIYLELAWQEASANDMGNDLESTIKAENRIGELFRSVSAKLSLNKMSRYSREDLKALMSPEGELNKLLCRERECAVCGSSNREITTLRLEDESSINICVDCKGMYLLGDKLPRLEYIKGDEDFVITVETADETSESPEVPSLNIETACLKFKRTKEAERGLKTGKSIKVYSVNRYMTGMNYSTNLWAGTYNAKNEETQKGLIDFKTLAERSRGIKRLGVLRADVDNLGQAFVSGFETRFVSLARYSTLSYYLSMFFKFEINKICRGRGGITQFRLIEDNRGENPVERDIVIVYSGGDDVFVVGAWDHVLEFAVDLREAFRIYTNGKMTLSAGFGLFEHKYPIAQMARAAGILEDFAKQNPEKDSIALFGTEYDRGEMKNFHTYRWEEFENGVCREKLAKLNKWFDMTENPDSGKLQCSMSFLYKLLHLFKRTPSEKINLARLAYLLARKEPGQNRENIKEIFHEMKNTIYTWASSSRDRKEFITALNLMVYLNRKEREK